MKDLEKEKKRNKLKQRSFTLKIVTQQWIFGNMPITNYTHNNKDLSDQPKSID